MAFKPLNPEQVQPTVQTLLSVLDRDETLVPAPMAEGVVSGKSFLRAILQGQLTVCQNVQEPPAPPPAPEPEPEPEEDDKEAA